MSADPCGCGCCTPAAGAAPLPVSNAAGTARGRIPDRDLRDVPRGADQAARAGRRTARSDHARRRRLRDRRARQLGRTSADILTFYSERTVNEAFLRTARLRDSVVRLSGHGRLRPEPGPRRDRARSPSSLEPGTTLHDSPPARACRACRRPETVARRSSSRRSPPSLANAALNRVAARRAADERRAARRRHRRRPLRARRDAGRMH